MTSEPSVLLSTWSDKLRAERLTYLSNEILADRDQRIVHELLAEAQGDLNSIDKDIAHIQAVLDGLAKRRTLTIQRIARLRSGIAPQKKLPPEILAKIFVQSSLPRWRSVAHAEPLLWAHLAVGSWPGDEASESDFHSLHDILSSRGGQGRVEIEIYPGTSDSWRTLLHLVSTHSARVWKLTLTLDRASSEPLSLPVREFDHVKSVSLSFITGISILGFANSPNIRTATLNFNGSSHVFLGNSPGRVFPWTQLTGLTLENIHPTSATRILTCCSKLITLELGLLSLMDIQDEESLVLLGGLKSLSIYLHSPGLLDILLSQLILPSLREFQVEYYDNENRLFSIGFPGFIAFIERSGCSINSIRIPNFILDIQDIIPALRVLPQLTELVINTVYPTPEHDLLIIQTERLLPNLRKFEGCTFSSIHSVIEFLKGRWALTTSGNYHGLEEFVFRLARDDYSATDQEILQNLLPEWERNGRRVQLVIEQR